MTEPAHDFVHVPRNVSFGQMRPLDQDNRHTQLARGCELCARSIAARVFGNDMGDAMRAQQGQVAFDCERATRQQSLNLQQWQCSFRGIDEAQQVEVLRPGGEGCESLFANREEDPGGSLRQSRNGGLYIAHVSPVIAGFCDPRQAFIGDKRRSGLGARKDGMAAHLRRKGMRGVDDVRDLLSVEGADEPVDPAEATHARRQWLFNGHRRASRIGENRGHCCFGQGQCYPGRLGRAAEKKDACHV